MKLYITPGSPYARMARIVILEKGLESRVEIIVAQTRLADSPYYRINPSGRVPYLIRDDGVGLEESALICDYLDQIDGKPTFGLPAGEEAWEARRLEALARSMVDGLAVWSRELARPENERSPTLLRHEAERSRRMADLWEREIDHPLMHGALNLAQMTLACGLGLEARNPDLQWRPQHPKLCTWFERLAARPSFAATAPQGAPSPAGESTADREFVTSRVIDAPRERVFRAFSDPVHLANWWGPRGFSSTFQEFNLSPGGAWRFVMHGPDGKNYPNESVFVEVVAPERIVFEHMSDHHFHMTITFTAQGNKTLVGWRQVFDTAAERKRIAKFVIAANEQNLDRLAAEVLNVR